MQDKRCASRTQDSSRPLFAPPPFEGEVQIQRSAKVRAPGFVNFITAVAYHFCPSLPAAITQPGASTLADLCTLAASHNRSYSELPVPLSAACTVGQWPTA